MLVSCNQLYFRRISPFFGEHFKPVIVGDMQMHVRLCARLYLGLGGELEPPLARLFIYVRGGRRQSERPGG